MKKPIGKQDQFIAAYGGLRFILFNREGITVEEVQLTKEAKRRLGERFMLFFTNRTREAEYILAEQKANIADRIGVLHELKKLAYQGKEAILAGAFDEFGEMLHKGWQLKKQLASKISDSELDQIYETALKNGAIGGKVTGAGGGGFLLLYCQNGRRDDLRRVLRDLEEVPFQLERDGSKSIFNYRG